MDKNRLFFPLIQQSSIADSSPFPLQVYPFVSRIALIYSLKVPALLRTGALFTVNSPRWLGFSAILRSSPLPENVFVETRNIHHQCLNLISIDTTTKSNDRFKSNLLFPFFFFWYILLMEKLRRELFKQVNKLI